MFNREKIQKKALQKSIDHARCGLAISMGVGKTRIALRNLLNYYHPMMRYLVVVPKTSIIDSWDNEIDKMQDEIEVAGGEDTPITVDMIKNCIDYVNYRTINKMEPSNYAIVYLDECHNLLGGHNNFLSKYIHLIGTIFSNFVLVLLKGAITDTITN